MSIGHVIDSMILRPCVEGSSYRRNPDFEAIDIVASFFCFSIFFCLRFIFRFVNVSPIYII